MQIGKRRGALCRVGGDVEGSGNQKREIKANPNQKE